MSNPPSTPYKQQLQPYTELQVTSNFSFLRGASHPEELVEQAAALGYTHLAITDRNTMAGIVRAYAACKKLNLKLIAGCALHLADGPPLLVYPTSIEGYAQLCQLLTAGNLRTEKGKCELYKKDVMEQLQEVCLVVQPPHTLNAFFELERDFADDHDSGLARRRKLSGRFARETASGKRCL